MTKVRSNLRPSPAEPPTSGTSLERHLHGGDDRLLPAAQAVHQEKAEQVPAREARVSARCSSARN